MKSTEPKYGSLIDYAYEGVYEKLLESVCSVMGVPVEVVKSVNRKREIVEARMIYMTLAQEFHPHNVSMMGRVVNRSHSTTLKSPGVVNDVRELYEKYQSVKQKIYGLCKL